MKLLEHNNKIPVKWQSKRPESRKINKFFKATRVDSSKNYWFKTNYFNTMPLQVYI